MSANESELEAINAKIDAAETGSPEARLREAEKQITIAKQDLADDEHGKDLSAAGSIVRMVANDLAVEDADDELTGGSA